MASPIVQAIKQIAEEKHLNYETVLETVESALAAAYRKDFGNKLQNIKIEFDPETGNMRAFDEKTVVSDELYEEYLKHLEEREKAKEEGVEKVEKQKTEEEMQLEAEKPHFSPKLNISLSEAKKIRPEIKVGEVLRTELEIPDAFGRVAAQTAKQVIMQRLREAERNAIFEEYKQKEHQVVTATVQRYEGKTILFDLGGRVPAIMRLEDQVRGEVYKPGARFRVYILSVEMSPRGPEILVSRSHPGLLQALFTTEIPEIANGAVKIKAIAREAGSRSKVAVYTDEPNVDPVGSCIGQRGVRIQTIISEIGGEKIDIIEYTEDKAKFIANALAPAKILSIDLNEKEKIATVKVAPDQLSLVIGRGGQNVRLAAHLTGWKINIIEKKETGEEEYKEEITEVKEEEGNDEKEKEGKEEKEERGETK
jgi:N utilization substance protein A